MGLFTLQELQPLIAHLADRLAVLSEVDCISRFPGKIEVGYTRHPIANASVTRIDGGHLILIHGGLAYACLRTAYLVAASMPLTVGDTCVPVSYVDQFAKDLFRGMLSKMSGECSSEISCPLPALSGYRNEMRYVLLLGAVDFIIAHELSHIIAGHLDELCVNIGREVFSSEYSWQHELEADSLAGKILNKAKHVGITSVKLSGLTMFFELVEAIQHHDRITSGEFRIQPQRVMTHPHPASRRGHVITTIVKEKPETAQLHLQVAGGVIKAIRRLYLSIPETNTEEAVAELAEMSSTFGQNDIETLSIPLRLGTEKNGVLNINFPETLAWLKEDHQRARATIAISALAYIRTGEAQGWDVGGMCSLLFMLYSRLYESDNPTDVASLYETLCNAIPEFPRIYLETGEIAAAGMRWPSKQPDSKQLND